MKAEMILWKDAEIYASGWSEQEIAEAKVNAVAEAASKFLAVKGAGKTIQLQDMVNSYSYDYRDNPKGFKGSVFKVYQINTVEDFINAFEDSKEGFTRYINRSGKYWYGAPRVILIRPK